MIALFLTSVASIGCGGGGSTSGNAPAAPQTPAPNPPAPVRQDAGTVDVTVVDLLGAPVPFADLSLHSNSPYRQATADSSGRATFTEVAPGNVEVNASLTETADSYFVGRGTATLEARGRIDVRVEIRPAADPVVGTSGTAVLSNDGRSLEFQVNVIKVGGNRNIDYDASGPMTFRLADCDPDTTNDALAFRADCVQGPSGFDASYRVVDPERSTAFIGEFPKTPSPYTASLLVDQSVHIRPSDPSNLRLLGIEHFFALVDQPNVATLAAFADGEIDLQPALLPQQPVTVYPSNDPAALADTIASLASLVGGGAPLYAAIDSEIERLRRKSTTADRFVVVVTDGHADFCGTEAQCAAARDAVAAKSRATSVEIVAIATGASREHRRTLAAMGALSGGRTFWLQEPAQLRLVLSSVPGLLDVYGIGETISFRIEATNDGVFQSGRTVLATLEFEYCPFECSGGSVPVAIAIP
jgi:hypothetical protein